jgi:hypothetical protein
MSTTDLVNKMAKYRDRFGLITQANGDGGDSCNRLAHYYAALQILNVPCDDINRHPLDGFYISVQRLTARLPFGRYRRHADTSMWYGDMDNVTRDQMSPMIATMVLMGTTELLKAHVGLRLRRLLLHFSTHDQVEGSVGYRWKLPDVPSPTELANIIRGLKLKLLYPLLSVLDLALLHEAKAANAANIHEGQMLLNTAVSLRTETTWAARKAAETLDSKADELAKGLRSYYAEGPWCNGILPLGELMVLVLKAL